jgi:UDP-N-acetylglucosamine 2-epimerase (non-hydrolysing)|tara:strand:- start:105 stop:1187 length:1083 start_codon:yes stop_codon:yes gene_type:complete
MASLIHCLKKDHRFKVKVCVTAQHRKMLDQVLSLFEIKPDFDLNLMKPNQNLNQLTASILIKIKPIFKTFKPDLVLVHGDTATTLSTTIASYYDKIPVGHVEAGLRTGDIYSPWPEEANRRLTSHIAKYHFAPTASSKKNLKNEGIFSKNIAITGNTVIDSLLWVIKKLKKNKTTINKLEKKFYFLKKDKKLILVTGHRRESFGEGFNQICIALGKLAHKYPEVQIVYPVHLNPNVQKPVYKFLKKHHNIFLLDPLEYLEFVYLMNRSYIIISDSGGIQEEAPSLGKPVLVMREVTERPEAIKAGTVKLVGTNSERIFNEAKKLLDNKSIYNRIKFTHNPYGNGTASNKIKNFLLKNLKK